MKRASGHDQPISEAGPLSINRADRRFLRWLATFCAQSGAEVGRVSTVIGRLARRGLITRTGKWVTLTPTGMAALVATGYRPTTDTDE